MSKVVRILKAASETIFRIIDVSRITRCNGGNETNVVGNGSSV
jgi:hypothetical protein